MLSAEIMANKLRQVTKYDVLPFRLIYKIELYFEIPICSRADSGDKTCFGTTRDIVGSKAESPENEPGNVTSVIWLRMAIVFLWKRGEVPDYVNFRFALQTRGLKTSW